MLGKVKWYNSEKKFGVIEGENGGEFFFLFPFVTDQSVKCRPGEPVEFDAVESKKKKNQFDAQNIRHPAGYVEKKIKIKAKANQLLYKWAFLNFYDRTDVNGEFIEGELPKLSELALNETWAYGDDVSKNNPLPILKNYIIHTFNKLYHEDSVYEATFDGKSWAAFNTGLVDDRYEAIYALFEQNPRSNPPWRLYSFCRNNYGRDGQILARYFNPLPPVARYFDNVQEVVFDAEVEVALRHDHVIYDGIKNDRYPVPFLEKNCPPGLQWKDPRSLKDAEKNQFLADYSEALMNNAELDRDVRRRIEDAVEVAIKRTRWNFKTAIPMYFAPKKCISLLLPVALVSDETVDMALAVVRNPSGGYSGETVYKLSWAYNHARLICRPDSDWLLPNSEDEEDELSDETEVATFSSTASDFDSPQETDTADTATSKFEPTSTQQTERNEVETAQTDNKPNSDKGFLSKIFGG